MGTFAELKALLSATLKVKLEGGAARIEGSEGHQAKVSEGGVLSVALGDGTLGEIYGESEWTEVKEIKTPELKLGLKCTIKEPKVRLQMLLTSYSAAHLGGINVIYRIKRNGHFVCYPFQKWVPGDALSSFGGGEISGMAGQGEAKSPFEDGAEEGWNDVSFPLPDITLIENDEFYLLLEYLEHPEEAVGINRAKAVLTFERVGK